MSPLNVHMHTNNSFHHDINLIPKSLFFFLPHLTSCLSYSSGNKIESKEQGLLIDDPVLSSMYDTLCLSTLYTSCIHTCPPIFIGVCLLLSSLLVFLQTWASGASLKDKKQYEHSEQRAQKGAKWTERSKVTVLEKVMRRFNTLSVDKYC